MTQLAASPETVTGTILRLEAVYAGLLAIQHTLPYPFNEAQERTPGLVSRDLGNHWFLQMGPAVESNTPASLRQRRDLKIKWCTWLTRNHVVQAAVTPYYLAENISSSEETGVILTPKDERRYHQLTPDAGKRWSTFVESIALAERTVGKPNVT